MTNSTYNGQCFCGTVKFKVSGTPEGMGYCHCESCRSWSASSVNGFTLWDPKNLRLRMAKNMSGRITKPKTAIESFARIAEGTL